MCSVSVFRQRDVLLVTMNRDEKRERHEDGLFFDDRHCYPLDGQSGGTWFGVNRYGLVAALLNRYEDATLTDAAVSRGTLIPQLLQLNSVALAVEHVKSLDLKHVNPYTLLLLDRLQSQTLSWNGRELTIDISTESGSRKRWQFLSSSSVNALQIPRQRLAVFSDQLSSEDSMKCTAPEILAMHLHREDNSPESAVFMDREATHTKSITQVSLRRDEVKLDYFSEESLAPVRQGLVPLPAPSNNISLRTLESI